MKRKLKVWTAVCVMTIVAAPAFASADTPHRKPPPGKNRLAFESSPYLLQHAGNPVDWYPWGKEAFAKAKAENKPIFLSIGYSTCYWCHVMERQSFADPEVAAFMNRYFVSIKVDREERPEVDEIYMTAVQMMTGGGGWPMSSFLTPDLKPFFGGTYFPKAQFMQLLKRVHAAWMNQREKLIAQAARVAEAIQSSGRLQGKLASKVPAAALITSAARQYGQSFDSTYAGFGGAPKFPQPSILELLMSHYEMTQEHHSMTMAHKTLDAMARGGMYDQIGGGFHRYSTDAQWLVPHFEKMLYDNAQLLHSYTRAYQLTKNPHYRRIAQDIVRYVRREMLDPSGLFYSAQDSEVDEEEGRSYVWTRSELQKVLSKSDDALVSSVYGLSWGPNFERRFNILYWPKGYDETAKARKIPFERLAADLKRINDALLKVRNKRKQPHKDDKSITAWNGLMIEAMAYAGAVLKQPSYVRIAQKAAGAVLKTLRDDKGRLLHVARLGKAKLDAYLDDYAAMLNALMELHRATGDARWKAEAANLADQMIERLWDAQGGFQYAAASVNNLIARPRDIYDGAVPTGNSLAVRGLARLAAGGFPNYAAYAAGTLKAYAPYLERAPQALPHMLWGLFVYRQSKLPENPLFPKQKLAMPSTADLVRVASALKKGDLEVTLSIEKGWHINANPASLDFLIPTRVEASLNGTQVRLNPTYPQGKKIDAGLETEKIAVYEGTVRVPVTFSMSELSKNENQQNLQVSVTAQACNDAGRCLAPDTIRTEIPFKHPSNKMKE